MIRVDDSGLTAPSSESDEDERIGREVEIWRTKVGGTMEHGQDPAQDPVKPKRTD